MKNVRESLLRRSFDNHILANRHNQRQDEMLEEKFLLYQRRIRLMDHKTYAAEHRLELHAKNALGLAVRYRCKTLEPSINREFYYKSTNKNCKAKEYSVEPLFRVLENKNIYEFAFEHRSKQYLEELRQRQREENLRKEKFLNMTDSLLVYGNCNRIIDWRNFADDQVGLPAIQNTRMNHSRNGHLLF